MSEYSVRSSSPLAGKDDLRRSPSIKSTKTSSSNASKHTSSTSSSVSSAVSNLIKLVTIGKASPVQDPPTGPALKSSYPSLFDENAKLEAASKAINKILVSLITCVKSFKCPSALDFSADADSYLLLVNNEKNKAFINQLLELSSLRAELEKIPTHGNVELKDKKHAAGTAIVRALQKMRDRQQELYNQSKTELIDQDPATALQNLHTSTLACTKRFQYPTELDFSKKKENSLVQTDKNRRFIDQLCKMEKYRDELSNVQTHGDVELEAQYRDVNVAIGKALQQLKAHQRKVYEKSLKRPNTA
ncbi:hypothetical protein BN14_11040 [Rhizoctonia solani AG-1 IB]|uniref:Uncharacterized protein n=1 Tax=Thanatephorus cucumeris (strain AG1-IB / isolate 7/3/14) TaxID=1108050 RepID=M5CA47_THACB|nr:hypothetical protein BN14_11040 [Rhizoctonia solani AG-1 IB]